MASKDWSCHLVFAVIVCSLGSGFQHGYNTGVVNQPQEVIIEFINDTEVERSGGSGFTSSEVRAYWSLIVSIYCVGGMLGSLMTPMIAEKLGRKKGLILNNVFAVIGGLLAELVRPLGTYELLVVARFFLGVNSGLNAGLAPMYLTEISPIRLRGALGSTYQLVITCSILLSQILGMPQMLGTKNLWPTLFAVIVIPAVLQAVVLCFCVESPRFVFSKTKDREKTTKVLVWLRQTDDVEEEIKMMEDELAAAEGAAKPTIRELLSDNIFRSMLYLSMVIMISQQLSGINAVIYFSTDLFLDAGLSKSDAFAATLGMGALNVIMTVVALWLVERVGRRLLYLFNVGTLCVITIALCLSLELQPSDGPKNQSLAIISTTMIFAFIIIFATGLGPIPWFVVNELFDQSGRSVAAGIATCVNWTCNFFVGLGFLPLKDVMFGYVFLVFTFFIGLSFVYTFLRMPETKNMTPEQVRAKVESKPWTQYKAATADEALPAE